MRSKLTPGLLFGCDLSVLIHHNGAKEWLGIHLERVCFIFSPNLMMPIPFSGRGSVYGAPVLFPFPA